jgi:hypothetical protein
MLWWNRHIAPEHVPARYGGLWRPQDEEFNGIEAPVKEVTVKGGEKHEIELPIAEVNGSISLSLALSLCFRHSDDMQWKERINGKAQ